MLAGPWDALRLPGGVDGRRTLVRQAAREPGGGSRQPVMLGTYFRGSLEGGTRAFRRMYVTMLP